MNKTKMCSIILFFVSVSVSTFSFTSYSLDTGQLYQACLTDLCGSAYKVSLNNEAAWKQKTSSKYYSKDEREKALESLSYKNSLIELANSIKKIEESIYNFQTKIAHPTDVELKDLIIKSVKENLILCRNKNPTNKVKDCFEKYHILSSEIQKYENLVVNDFSIKTIEDDLLIKINARKSSVISGFRYILDRAHRKLLNILSEIKSPLSGLNIADYIIYKIVTAEEDVRKTKVICDVLPKRILILEQSMFDKMKRRYSSQLISEFKSYYYNMRKRFGNCGRISLENFVKNAIDQFVNSNDFKVATSDGMLFSILTEQTKLNNEQSLIEKLSKFTSQFASEFLIDNTNGEFYFNKSPEYPYVGNYYTQPGFFLEVTYLHEIGHVFEFFLKTQYFKKYEDIKDRQIYQNILLCLEERNPKSKDQALNEDFADWFSSVHLSYGTWGERSNDFCKSINIKDGLYEYDEYVQVSGKHSTIIFRLLQQRLQLQKTNKLINIPDSCIAYLNEQSSKIARTKPCL